MSKVDHRKRLTINEKFAVCRRLYNWAKEQAETYDEKRYVGADLAYLMGAVLNGGYVEHRDDSFFLELLTAGSFKGKDLVMLHVKVVQLEEG
jgi:hypothetical protein